MGDVDLCIGRQGGSAANSNEKQKFHSPEIDNPRPPYNSTVTVCQGFTVAEWWRKVTELSFFVFEGSTREVGAHFGALAKTSRVS